tara:strand:- start:331 stop:678 length:348 start_codon:yes stop_codon:yes gene_type:complete
MEQIAEPGLYEPIFNSTKALVEGFQAIADEHGIPFTTNHAGSMFGLFFTDVDKVVNYQQAINCNQERFKQFYHGMLDEGVYLAPASYEAGFVSKMHTQDIVDATLEAARKVFANL